MNFAMDAPPELTGDAQTDIKNLYNHAIKLQEELEFFIGRISKSNE